MLEAVVMKKCLKFVVITLTLFALLVFCTLVIGFFIFFILRIVFNNFSYPYITLYIQLCTHPVLTDDGQCSPKHVF